MSLLATLLVRLSADSTELQAGFDKARKQSKSFGAELRRDANEVANTFAKIGLAAGAAAAGGMAALTVAAFKNIDALAKTADKLGIATEALAGLNLAAQDAGIAQEALANGLVRQQRAIDGANNGAAEAARAFQQLGLDTQKLAELNPAQQFALIADSLTAVENQTTKTAIATQIFGRSGADLINVLAFGSEGLAKFAAEAETLGLAINRVDAAKIEQANDAFERIGLAAQGLGNKIAIAIAPEMEAVSKLLVQWITGFDLAAGTAEQRTQAMADSIRGVVNTFQLLGDGFSLFANLVRSVGAGVVSIFTRIAEAALTVYRAFLSLQTIAFDFASKLPKNLGGDLFAGFKENSSAAYTALQVVEAQLAQFRQGVLADTTEGWKEYWASATGELQGKKVADQFIELTDAAKRAAEQVKAAGGGIDLSAIDGSGIGDVNKQAAEGGQVIKPPVIDLSAYKANLETQAAMKLEQLNATAEAERLIEQKLREDIIAGRVTSDQELLQLAQSFAAAKIQAEYDAEVAAREALGLSISPEDEIAKQIEAYQRIQDETTAILQNMKAEQGSILADIANQAIQQDQRVLSAKANLFSALGGLYQAFAGKSKGIATAILAVEKASAIANVFVNTQVAAMKALATLGPIAGPPVAAAIQATGKLQIAAIAATALGQAIGGGSFGGISTAPGGTSSANPDLSQNQRSEAETRQTSAVTVNFNGDLNGWDAYVQNKVIGAIRDAVKDRDVVLIDSGSRNARDIVSAYA